MTTKHNYGQLRNRADKLSRMIMDRARQAGIAAHCGSIPLMWHNAMVSRDYGQPWREVDYKALRRARWLEEKSFEPNRILDRLYKRVGPDGFDWT